MSTLGEIASLGVLFKAIARLLELLSSAKDKIYRYKDEKTNKEVKGLIINGDVNAPLFIVDRNGKLSFGSQEWEKYNGWIKNRLEKGRPTSIVNTKFDKEYEGYGVFYSESDYPHPFIKLLDAEYRGLIKASMYVKKLYDEGDRDTAGRRKEELTSTYKNGRKFCNLYTEGYIPQVLENIQDVGLTDKNMIQQLLEYIVSYKGVYFVHNNTNDATILAEIYDNITHKLDYMAIHGTDSSIEKVKMLLPEIKKMTNGTDYSIIDKSKPLDKTKKGDVHRYAIYIYNGKGKKTYIEFMDGTFKGFI